MQIKTFTLSLALLALSATSLDLDARERDRRGEGNYAYGQQHGDARSEARDRASRGQPRDSYAQSQQYRDSSTKHGRYDGRNDRRHDGRYQQHGRHDRHGYMQAGYGFYNQPRHYYGPSRHYAPTRHHGHQRYRAPSRYSYPRGYHAQRWNVGVYLPSSYYASHYYIDYRHYGLARPPRGHHWVRIDNDVVLVAIASGLVTQVLFDLLYY